MCNWFKSTGNTVLKERLTLLMKKPRTAWYALLIVAVVIGTVVVLTTMTPTGKDPVIDPPKVAEVATKWTGKYHRVNDVFVETTEEVPHFYTVEGTDLKELTGNEVKLSLAYGDFSEEITFYWTLSGDTIGYFVPKDSPFRFWVPRGQKRLGVICFGGPQSRRYMALYEFETGAVRYLMDEIGEVWQDDDWYTDYNISPDGTKLLIDFVDAGGLYCDLTTGEVTSLDEMLGVSKVDVPYFVDDTTLYFDYAIRLENGESSWDLWEYDLTDGSCRKLGTDDGEKTVILFATAHYTTYGFQQKADTTYFVDLKAGKTYPLEDSKDMIRFDLVGDKVYGWMSGPSQLMGYGIARWDLKTGKKEYYYPLPKNAVTANLYFRYPSLCPWDEDTFCYMGKDALYLLPVGYQEGDELLEKEL